MLEHLPSFGVVICTICRYAVQPLALDSHLRGHRMYRKQRKRLLEELAALNLLEADLVPVPPPGSLPQPSLPIYEGHICLKLGCGRKYASQKRMEMHWSEDHGESDSKKVQARHAQLQTFFRGSKVRYFEVNRSGCVASGEESTIAEPPCTDLAATGSLSRRVDPNAEVLVNLDATGRHYYQHYCKTPDLIPHRDLSQSEDIWHRVVHHEASKHDFLLDGILGLAAAHLSLQAETDAEREGHLHASLRYQARGATSFRTVISNAHAENSMALVVFGRLIGIQRLLLHQLALENNSGPLGEVDEIQTVLEMFCLFRGQAQVLSDLQHLLPPRSEFKQTTGDSIQSFDHVQMAMTDLSASSRYLDRDRLVRRIIALPSKLSHLELFASLEELQTIQQAATDCLAGVIRSFSSPSLASRWQGLTAFILVLSPFFAEMLKGRHPAALVFFGHWCPLLLALEPEYAFLQGQSARLLRILRQSLRSEVATLLDRIEGETVDLEGSGVVMMR